MDIMSSMSGMPQDERWQDRYAAPGWQKRLTQLPLEQELQFQQWAKHTGAPITDDYDMRGFWKNGGKTSLNQNDGLPHFTDEFKTPLHESFSGESVYARPNSGAPSWNDQDQLVLPDGSVVFDERYNNRALRHPQMTLMELMRGRR